MYICTVSKALNPVKEIFTSGAASCGPVPCCALLQKQMLGALLPCCPVALLHVLPNHPVSSDSPSQATLLLSLKTSTRLYLSVVPHGSLQYGNRSESISTTELRFVPHAPLLAPDLVRVPALQPPLCVLVSGGPVCAPRAGCSYRSWDAGRYLRPLMALACCSNGKFKCSCLAQEQVFLCWHFASNLAAVSLFVRL